MTAKNTGTASAAAATTFCLKSGQVEGCLLGGLIGDALGFPFENEYEHQYSSEKIQQLFDGLSESKSAKNSMQYTDDTLMTRSIIEQILMEGPTVNAQQWARSWADTYASEKVKLDRNYPVELTEVLEGLEKNYFSDIYGPAEDLNGGQGSTTNGAACRVAPIALMTAAATSFSPNGIDSLVEFCIESARITHSNSLAILGTIFQALAIRHALIWKESAVAKKTAPQNVAGKILEEFTKDFESLRTNPKFKQFFAANFLSHKALSLFMNKIYGIQDLLREGQQFDVKQVKAVLGVKRNAVDSVPTAFFCFLASFQPISFIVANNQFQRTIQLALALGGDADTIGSMAGNICGAFVGVEDIPPNLTNNCEGAQEMLKLAGDFFQRISN